MKEQHLPVSHPQPNGQPTFIIKPYNTKELTTLYGITYKTFAKWLKPFKKDLGERQGRLYTALQVEMILKKIGPPYRYVE